MKSHSVRPVGLGVSAAVAACALVFANGSAVANPPITTMQWYAGGDNHPPALYDCAGEASAVFNHGGGTWQFLGSLTGDIPPGGSDPYWALNWDVSVNGNSGGAVAGGSGSFVTADLQITNFTNQSQVFWALVTVTLDNPIIGPGTFISGSSTAGVNGFGGTPASIQNPTSGPFAGDPVYTGLIDGNEVRTLFDNFFLPTSGGPVSDSTTFGDPTPEIGPDAISSISVWLKIEVSAFATASVTGTLIVDPIPAPAALPLLAGLALFGRRRSRV